MKNGKIDDTGIQYDCCYQLAVSEIPKQVKNRPLHTGIISKKNLVNY